MSSTPDRLIGVYDADGSLRGEVSYVVGKLLGRRHCALCDITHSPVRRKPQWNAMVADLGVRFDLRHRDELTAAEADAVRGVPLPVVLAEDPDGLRVLLDSRRLDTCGGDVDRFRSLLRDSLNTLP